MTQVGVVASREFMATVRRKSYLIVTFGMPFFALIYIGMFAVLPSFFMAQSGRSRKQVGLVDDAGIVRAEELTAQGERDKRVQEKVSEISERFGGSGAGGKIATTLLDRAASPVRFRIFQSRDAALTALRTKTIERFYLIGDDYVASGGVDSYQSDDVGFGLRKTRSRSALATLLSRSLARDQVPDAIRARLEHPILPAASESFVIKEDGSIEPLDVTARIARLAIPGVFGMLLMMSLMTSAGYLLQGVSEEKENRVIEVILSSVRPDQLLFGKLLGLGAAGLLQLIIWISVVSLATSLLAAAALAVLDAYLFFSCLIFFILGFLMIGSLMIGTGALGTNSRESQQLAAIWSILAVLPPALTFVAILDEPNGWVARLFGWFPLSAPITMMLRLGTGKVPLWDVLVAILFLVLGVYLGVRAAGALFRLGLLMYGKRPSILEIVRQLRR